MPRRNSHHHLVFYYVINAKHRYGLSDPYLAGIGGGLITGGMQDAGVISTVKHFLLNEQEYRRMPDDLGESMSSNADDRTIHEFYAWPFYDSLKAGAGSVMCSYQRVNNSYSCQNSALLNGLLKTEMGFEGFVVSDWDAQHAGVATANSGMDVVMPDGGYWGQNLTAAVANGSVSTDRLDDMATRVLAAHYFTGQTKNFPAVEVFTYTEQHPIVDVRADHAKLIREIGAAGHVILKNVNGTLPFVKPRYLNIYGYDAEVKASPWENPSRYGGGYEVNWGWDTFNGTLITGGGSGSNSPPYVISPFKALQDRLIADNGILRWDFFSQDPIIYANADACLVFINSYASESFDRLSLTDDWSDQLVLNVAAGCSNTVVVLHSAGVRTVEAWIDHSNVTAVVFAGLPGQESGYSLVDVLYGEVNATGRLPFTVAHNESDYGEALNSTVDFSAFPQSNFTEGLYVDYRHFDAKNITPRFEFGYGLTYTTFEYSDFVVNAVNGTSTATYPAANISIVQGGHPQLWDILYVLHANVTNTGSRAGAEIAQLYLGIPDSPAKQLRGFEKVVVDVGETKEAVFEVRRRDLSIWNTTAQDWELQSGEYQAWIGSSSRNLHLDLSFAI